MMYVCGTFGIDGGYLYNQEEKEALAHLVTEGRIFTSEDECNKAVSDRIKANKLKDAYDVICDKQTRMTYRLYNAEESPIEYVRVKLEDKVKELENMKDNTITAARAMELRCLVATYRRLGYNIPSIALTNEEKDYCYEWQKYCADNNPCNAKSEKKEQVMDKYLMITNDGLAKYCKDMAEAKKEATGIIEAGCEEVYIYEKKIAAGVIKPKVEFKEV